jgi:hypothetical protein
MHIALSGPGSAAQENTHGALHVALPAAWAMPLGGGHRQIRESNWRDKNTVIIGRLNKAAAKPTVNPAATGMRRWVMADHTSPLGSNYFIRNITRLLKVALPSVN